VLPYGSAGSGDGPFRSRRGRSEEPLIAFPDPKASHVKVCVPLDTLSRAALDEGTPLPRPFPYVVSPQTAEVASSFSPARISFPRKGSLKPDNDIPHEGLTT